MEHKKTGAVGLMMVSVTLLAAACGGGGSGAGAGSGAAGTLNLSMSTGSFTLTGLSYSAQLSTASGTVGGYSWLQDDFNNGVADAAVDYYSTSTEDTLDFLVTPNRGSTWYDAGPPPTTMPSCWVSGASNPIGLPLCTTWGIAISRTAGTITFTNTPVFNSANPAVTGTMSGTLTFPPF